MTTVYKVVQDEPDGRLTSITATDSLEVEYQPGRWVEAPIGGLLCFADYESAQQFRAGQVWLADAEDPVPLPPRGMVWPTEEQARMIWEGRISGTMQWPEGTVAFRRVRLRTRVT
jgi:hypothetical protein